LAADPAVRNHSYSRRFSIVGMFLSSKASPMRIGPYLSNLVIRGIGNASSTGPPASGLSGLYANFQQKTGVNTFNLAPIVRDSLSLKSGGSQSGFESSKLNRVGVLVETIRSLVSTEASAGEDADRQTLVDTTLKEIAELTGAELRLGGAGNALIEGVNQDQIAHAQVTSLAPGGNLTVAGEVTQTADVARLVLSDDDASLLTQGGRFTLSTGSGSATFLTENDQSLASVADRINQLSEELGALATASGGTLVVESLAVGSAATVQLEQVSASGISEATVAEQVTGVNATQVTGFTIGSLQTGQSESIEGSVISSATLGEVRYVGSAGVVAGTASFRLTGSNGSVDISITAGESLSDAAARINAESGNTGVVAEVESNEIHFNSIESGSGAFVQVEALSQAERIETAGVDGNQVVEFDIVSIAAGTSETISGEVLQTAVAAELTLRIGAGGTVDSNATFDIDGDLGQAEIEIFDGESLSSVVDRINADTGSTGVVAELSGDDILLTSSNTGDTASVAISLTDIEYETIVSGVNASQLQNFQVESFTEGAEQTLSGTITQASEQAELRSSRGLGSANFTLTGSLGSTTISVSFFESASSIADQINQASATTGVSATVDSGDLVLRSAEVGSDAAISVVVNSGSFNTTGGNGDGTANGVDAAALINGEAVTATGDNFAFADAQGSYSFAVTSGFTGAFDSVTVTSEATFETVGGNGDGTANGQNAIAELNGAQYSSSDNRFDLTTANGQFELEFAAGFTGQFSDITVSSTFDGFEFKGAGVVAGGIGGGDVKKVESGTNGGGG